MKLKSLFQSKRKSPLGNANQKLDKNPQDFLALMERADAFMEQHNAKSAVEDIERAIQLVQIKFGAQISEQDRKEVLAKLYTAQSRALHGLGSLQEALAAIEHAIKENDNDLDAITQRGRIQRDLGNFESALKNFDFVISKNNRFAQAHVGKGMVLQEKRNLQEAIKEYDIALEIDKNLAIAWSSRGNVYFNLNRFDKAESDLLTAIQLDPYLTWAYIGLSQISRLVKKDIKKALSLLNAGLKYNPQNSSMLVLVARIYLDGGKMSEAMSILNSVIGRDSQSGEALSVRGQIYGSSGKIKEAIIDLKKAADLLPKDTENLFNLAITYVQDKNQSFAIQVLERLLTLNPNDSEARSFLNQLLSSK